jgi:hypothetical protein
LASVHNEAQTAAVPFQAVNKIPPFDSHSRTLKHQYSVPSFDPYARLLEQQYNAPSFVLIEQQHAYVGLAIVCFMSGYLMASLPRRRRRQL